MENGVKIVLAVLLLGCLANIPYGYYQLVRFVAAAGFVYLAIQQTDKPKQWLFYVYVLLALLFQPFLKVSLGRELWNLTDVAVAVFLLATLFPNNKDNNA